MKRALRVSSPPRTWVCWLAAIGCLTLASPGFAQTADEPQLRFNFVGADWPSVLTWFSQEADLSLQLDDIPGGSFSYSDPSKAYEVPEALDVINLALLKRGYVLVRRGRMLQVIDLERENVDKLISDLAELVSPDELESRGRSDIVSVVLPLGGMTPDQARAELAELVGPSGRVIVLDSARRVKVTETAEKLIAIRDLLAQTAATRSTVIDIAIKNRGADELLEIARPLLDIPAGEFSGEDIRLSVGPLGDRIFAIGTTGKTTLLRSIIEKADKPLEVASDESSDGALPTFRTHPIEVADPSTVFDVLQTLLAGTPDARIAIEPKTNAIVAFARPETQSLIQKTIGELEGNGRSTKVITLRRLDPAQALLTINKYFGVSGESGEGPVVDGDPATGKLWIRGTDQQIELVEALISQLEGDDSLGELGDRVRILPYTGRGAEDAVRQVMRLWSITGRGNPIRVLGKADDAKASGIPERRREADEAKETSDRRGDLPDDRTEASARQDSGYTFVSDVQESIGGGQTSETEKGAEPTEPSDQSTAGNANSAGQQAVSTAVAMQDVIIEFTPGGVMIASEDTEALDAIETLFASLADASTATSDLPTIFWLKYAEAEPTAELISSILGGAETSIGDAVDSVAGSLGGGMLGGLMSLAGGGGGEGGSSAKSVLTAAGSVSIVPDARLNALIVQAGPADLQFIELLLEKIDQQESPEDVETAAKPQLIPVIYQDAAEIAEVIKEVFGDRIAGKTNKGGGGGPPSPQDFFAALRGGRGGGGGGGDKKTASEPPKIAVSVNKKSNVLVVVATPQDFAEVETLVEALDQGSVDSEETIETITMKGNMNPEAMRAALQSIVGPVGQSDSKSGSSSTTGASSSKSGPGNTSTQSADDIRRRIEFFRALRGGGRGGGGFGRGGRGGGFGGGRGGSSGGGRGGRGG